VRKCVRVLDGVVVVLRSDDDVVDGDVDELDEEADEAHDGEPDGSGDGDLLELWKREIFIVSMASKNLPTMGDHGFLYI
jgi:hypothetical protein